MTTKPSIQSLLLFFVLLAQRPSAQTCQNLVFTETADLPSTCFQMTLTALHDQLDRPFLYVANKEAGLKIYDLTEPQAPQPAATIATSQFDGLHVMNLSQQGNFLYLAIGNHFGTAQQSPGLAVVDVSEPGSPVLTDFWKWQANDGGAGIAVAAGDLVYLGAMKHGLILLDVSDKTDIQFVSQFVPDLDYPDPNPDASKINARGMQVKDGFVYLCYDAGGLRIIDASDPENPTEIGRYANPALNGLPRAYNNVIVENGLAYVAVDYCGLEILDVTDPAQISLTGWWNPWNCQSNPLNWFSSPGHTNELAFLPECGLLFLADGKSDLHVVDVSDPAQPDSCSIFGGVDNGIGTWGVSLWQEQVYLSYICNFLPFPFPSNWTGVKILDMAVDCPTPISQAMENQAIGIAPNPFSTQLKVTLPNDPGPCQLTLHNMIGQLVFSQKIASGTEEWMLETGHLNTGVYLLGLRSGPSIWAELVVK